MYGYEASIFIILKAFPDPYDTDANCSILGPVLFLSDS